MDLVRDISFHVDGNLLLLQSYFDDDWDLARARRQSVGAGRHGYASRAISAGHLQLRT